jgi:hypothetical protein
MLHYIVQCIMKEEISDHSIKTAVLVSSHYCTKYLDNGQKCLINLTRGVAEQSISECHLITFIILNFFVSWKLIFSFVFQINQMQSFLFVRFIARPQQLWLLVQLHIQTTISPKTFQLLMKKKVAKIEDNSWTFPTPRASCEIRKFANKNIVTLKKKVEEKISGK